MKLLLEDYPNMFDRIEVRRVGRVFVDLDVVLLKPFSNWCSMHWSIILQKYGVADGVVNALQDRKDKVLQQLEVHPCIRRFHHKGTDGSSSQNGPRPSRKLLCPFFWFYALSFPPFRPCSEYPDLV